MTASAQFLNPMDVFAGINDSFWFISIILLMYVVYLGLRQHRTDLVLFSIYPGDKEHLYRPAAIPVALFIIRPDTPYTGSKSLRDECRKRRISLGGDSQLPFGGR